ncbi:type II secretion system F family protein [Actinomadura hibisca]|uniref:type II secretion system F family protein n=1 Tax=Actinomadura hibisca TaxID=68565 RepID=UPI000AF34AA8|nr:type II secretion system F family protein [Actinomadura hibisca]
MLAALCAAGATWTFMAPPPTTGRLARFQADRSPAVSLTDRLYRLLAAGFTAFRERGRRPQQWRMAVIELCDGMAAELAAGRSPDEAFKMSAAILDPHISARLLGGARLEALAAEHPGAEGLRLLAACWRVGAEQGGTLASVLDGLASALRAEETQHQEIAAQLAAPRVTARMLALLPLLGLGMGAALGANPVAFLLGTLPGAGCLAGGITLDLVGLWWTRRLAQAAEAPR